MPELGLALISGMLLLAGATACSAQDRAPAGAASSSDELTLTMSMYVVLSENGVGSTRTEEELLMIAEGMNDIWAAANVRLQPRVLSIRVPSEVLADLARGSGRQFYEQAGVSFPLPGLSDVNGFYIPSLGGANGVADPRLGTFFVIDQPTVFDRRVSAHEVGHLLGLSHDTGDRSRLMFSGTNGMLLTDEEIARARAGATAIQDSDSRGGAE